MWESNSVPRAFVSCFHAVSCCSHQRAGKLQRPFFESFLARVPLCVSHTLFQRAFVSCYVVVTNEQGAAGSSQFCCQRRQL